ncbi:LacI family DNA-binding transcriptional regulator [Caproicibacterium argilliputei]|uniref:LacI family DNA-binding transcriptional regulator n=1 Tax=Caproicibacterium argilliputei TaxID=3030016 RepID=A0AA97DAJ7_9FIRM|nr:LacI family DNA-binding transcriptional regulator [Caproicibacterium argilliputei]WOC32652.1 LacI family DNA-binding transcriptional regulator [Caproicibacterium argilliputei]
MGTTTKELEETQTKDSAVLHIGAVLPNLRSNFLSRLMNALILQAEQNRCRVQIALHDKDPQQEYRLIRRMAAERPDALLLCPINQGARFEQFLKRLAIPTAAVGNYISPDFPFISSDEKQAAVDAVALLAAKGYRKLVFVCPQLAVRAHENIHTHEQRTYGFIEATHKQNLEAIIVGTADFLTELDMVLQNGGPRTAILASGDTCALQVMQHLQKKGLRVPADIGVMGFGNIDALQYIHPSLATVSRDLEAAGRASADVLQALMENRPAAAETLLPCHVIDGGTL